LDGLSARRVSPSPEAIASLCQLDGGLPEDPVDPREVLALLDEVGSPATVASTGGRYFGFVIGGALPASLAASWLAAAWDQNAGLMAASPVAGVLEETALAWLLELLRLPPDAAGAFVTGATMANFTALAAARHAVLVRAGWDVEARGLRGSPPCTVVVGAEAHATIFKTLALLGFGRDEVVRVPVDAQGRMRPDAFPALHGPAIVCVQAGNVNTGAFDPAGELCELAQAAGAWVHVDGAFGLWAAVAPERTHLVAGVELADSWATDAHKWLNVPYDSGLAFVRDAAALRAAMAQSGAYYIAGEHREPMFYTPETSRRARGTEIWAALRSLGRTGLAELIERDCQHATRFAEGLRAAGYEVLNEVVLNQVLVAFGDEQTTRRVIAAIQHDGTCWCGGTSWHGRVAMRISVSSWATTADDVERSLAAMVRIAREVVDGR
ncbi:MAG: aspartate aminotransferase family protein, partial [Chloroflexi bacterium]|nr:aspartate aminotransferase family protein [Chloroflexota bacterium]